MQQIEGTRGSGEEEECRMFFFREQRGVLHESGASTQLGETRPTDPIAPRVVFVASARANVTPLESRQPALEKDSWLLAFLPGCRLWRRLAPPSVAVTGAVCGHGRLLTSPSQPQKMISHK